MPCLLFLTLLWWTAPALAEGFICAGSQGSPTEAAPLSGVAAKPARIAATTTGTRRALVLFARFKGEDTTLPSWAADLFNPDLPGSFSHFYDTMSFGRLQVRGEVASKVYESAKPASAYLSASTLEPGEFGQFSLEILRQADEDIDFAQFDNDGPDGIPNSGDDDGVVDAVLLVLDRIPANFLQGEATGIMGLGGSEALATSDIGASGKATQIFPGQGTIQQGRFFAEAVGAMCHEYGHVLGLPDLYNTDFLGKKGTGPEDDSAGVGAWCLMGWGASGWHGNDGPTSFCAWSRMKLGWAQVEEPKSEEQQVELEPVGLNGQLYLIPVDEDEFFLLEYRTRQGTYYDRQMPGEGLLVWHMGYVGQPLPRFKVDLECADGLWLEAGYPEGKTASAPVGDNLDFWAHDEAYSSTHAGNLGDATDPFDGAHFDRFIPESNPSSRTLDGRSFVRIEGIHAVGGKMHARVQTAPSAIEVDFVGLIDRDGDGTLVFGEEAAVNVQLINRGGLPAEEVEVRLKTKDPLIEIEQESTSFGTLGVGQRSGQPLEGLPQIRLAQELTGNRSVDLEFDVFVAGQLAKQQMFSVKVGSFYQRSVGDTQDGVVLVEVLSVSGIVHDIQGDPLPNVEISGNINPIITAADGTFTLLLRKGVRILTFGRPSADPQLNIPQQYRSVSAERGKRVSIVLEYGVPVKVQVVGENGEGVHPATVWMSSLSSEARGTTDAQGNTVVDMVPGVYTLRLLGVNLPYAEKDVFPVPVAGDTTVRLVVGRGSQVSGQVRNVRLTTGQLFLVPLDGERSTYLPLAAAGAYEARLANGRFLAGFRSSGRYPTQSLGVIDVTGDKTVDFDLEPGERVVGQVRAPEGQGLERIVVQAFSPAAGLAGRARTNAEGLFELFLKKGEYELVGAGDSGRNFWNLGTATVDPLSSLVVQRPGGAQLEGRVVDGVGRPLNNVLVMLTHDPRSPVMIDRPAGLGVTWFYKQGTALEAAGLSGAKGTYQLEARKGHYAVVVLPSETSGIGKVVRDFDLAEDQSADFFLDSPPKTYLVYGRIWDEADLPRGTVLLQFYDKISSVLVQAKSSAGRGYQLELPAGEYQVRAALVAPTGGFLKLYEVGGLMVGQDQQWDIHLADAVTAVEEDLDAKPTHFSLEPAYPNPFNPTTTIRFSLPQPGEADLAIYNLLGQRVATLVRGVQEAGPQVLQWNGRDEAGHELASGVYFYRLQAGTQVETRKLLRCR